MRRACTIIARNYWAHARVLAESLAAHHSDVKLSVLVIDADAETRRAADRESFEVLSPHDLGIDGREFHRMAGIYELLELATALKPSLLRHLLSSGCCSVVYLDPDIEVFAPLDELWDLASEHGILITPHSTEPFPSGEKGAAEELMILGAGAYNLGFIGVGAGGRSFLDWWAERLRRDGLIAKDAGMFVDQRWIDLVPSYFDVHLLRAAGWNVAYWNLGTRRLTRVNSRFLVNGEPLRFFHFSGYRPERPEVLSHFEGDSPRQRVDEDPILAELCSRYTGALLRQGYRAFNGIPFRYACTSRGLPLDIYARRLYRRELLASEASGQSEPPNPFDADGGRAFEHWLRAQAAPHGVTRYLRFLWEERADIRGFFRDLDGPEARFYVDWARTRGRFEPNVAADLVALDPHRRRSVEPIGVNVAGYVKAESGVGEAARLLLVALDAADVPRSIVPFTQTASRQEDPFEGRGATPTHPTNIVCVNADAFPTFLAHAGDFLPVDRRTIGVWAWEVEEFPETMASAAEQVDEIWMPSEHAARAVREHTDKPVFVFPHPIVRPAPSARSRASFGVPDAFTFLFCFDFDSVFERKNPLGVIEAFSRAFEPGAGPQLLIKSVRGEAHPEELERIRLAAAGRADIHVHDGYLSRPDQAALMNACDAYVSLHRAEGFGLTMAEAMSLGKPVVATAYSGNLEFMDVTNSWLVPYELVPIPDGCDPYPVGARWASPDIGAAAEILRSIVDDPFAARERGARAAEDMARLHSPHARAPFLIERLRDVPVPPEVERARLRPERPWAPVESADRELTTGPDIHSPTSYGFISRVVRRIVLRVARHYVEHQEKIQSSMLVQIQDLDARVRAEIDASRELEHKVRELQDRVDEGVTRSRPTVVRADVGPAREQRMRSYARLFGSHAPVLAVGREAKDLIQLLGHQGVDAFALDGSGSNGLSIDLAAVLDGLATLADRSLGGILTVRVIDELSVTDLERFLDLSRRKLHPGGVLVAETEDLRLHAPQMTGQVGLPPEALLELCRSTGFEQAYVLFPTGAGTTRPDEINQGEFAIVASVLAPS